MTYENTAKEISFRYTDPSRDAVQALRSNIVEVEVEVPWRKIL